MTLEELQKLSLLEILGKFNYMQRRLNDFVLGGHTRRKHRSQVEQLKELEIIRGNVIPLYHRDEFTGLHIRSTGPANYILNNEPPPDRAA